MKDERGRNLDVDEKIRLVRERFGFVKCPECGTEHTATTVTCRECGYCDPRLKKKKDGEREMETRIVVKEGVKGKEDERPVLLRIRQGVPLEIVGEGNVLEGNTMDVPRPEELKRVKLKNLYFFQEGDMLVISPHPDPVTKDS